MRVQRRTQRPDTRQGLRGTERGPSSGIRLSAWRRVRYAGSEREMDAAVGLIEWTGDGAEGWGGDLEQEQRGLPDLRDRRARRPPAAAAALRVGLAGIGLGRAAGPAPPPDRRPVPAAAARKSGVAPGVRAPAGGGSLAGGGAEQPEGVPTARGSAVTATAVEAQGKGSVGPATAAGSHTGQTRQTAGYRQGHRVSSPMSRRRSFGPTRSSEELMQACTHTAQELARTHRAEMQACDNPQTRTERRVCAV